MIFPEFSQKEFLETAYLYVADVQGRNISARCPALSNTGTPGTAMGLEVPKNIHKPLEWRRHRVVAAFRIDASTGLLVAL